MGNPSSDTVPVTDDDPVITISGPTSSIEEGNDAEFRIQANGAPRSDITINIAVSDPGGFLSNAAPSEVTLSEGNASVSLPLSTRIRTECEDQGAITVTIEDGTNYTVGSDDVAKATVTSLPAHCVIVPVITITAGTSPITEGTPATFTITATPAPTVPLNVNFSRG